MPDGEMLAAIGGSGQSFDLWGVGLLAAQPVLLFLGLLIEALIGGLPGLWRNVPHPVALLGRLIALLDRQLNREQRSEPNRRARGIIVAVTLIALAGSLGVLLQTAARELPFGWILELAVIIVLLASRNLFDHVRAVAVALDRGGVAGGRRAGRPIGGRAVAMRDEKGGGARGGGGGGAGREGVRHIVGRDVAMLDEYGVARAAIESSAENFSDAVVAPTVWYLLLGLPGLLIYKTVNTMDSMIGYRTPRHEAFGKAAARIDDVLNFVPARLAALMIVFAAAFTPGGSPRRAWSTLLRDGGNHASPNSGRPEAAMAGALGLALAGPRPYNGAMKPAPWIGKGVARATARDIRRALYVYMVANVINLLMVAGFAWLVATGDRITAQG